MPDSADPILMINTEHGWRGGESQLLLLVRGLAGRRRTITVCQPGCPLAMELRRSGLEAEELAMRGGFDPLAAWRLRGLIRRHRTGIIHAHTSHAHGLALLAAAGMGIPVVVSRRVDFPVRASRWGKYGPRVTRFIAVSRAIAEVLKGGGVAADRIAVIHDGVSTDAIAPGPRTLREELALPAEAVLVGCIAHLADHKDHRTLLQAWRQVEERCSGAHLAIVGRGELEGALRSQAAALGLRRVVFTGFRTDIPAILRSLDVLALTSHLEGLGSSVADGMLRGLPVVATRAGGLPELVEDGVTGFLARVRDADGVASALIRLCEPGASGLRARLGSAGREAAMRGFTAERMVEAHLALYHAVQGKVP